MAWPGVLTEQSDPHFNPRLMTIYMSKKEVAGVFGGAGGVTSHYISVTGQNLPFFHLTLMNVLLIGRSAAGLRITHYKHSCSRGGVLWNVFTFFRADCPSSFA